MKTELKPCPFCGGAVTIADYGSYLCIIAKGTDPKTSCRCRLFMESEQFSADDEEARQRAKERLVEKWDRRASPWHTGTPTEGGLYFVYDKYAGYGKRELPEDIEAKDLELVFTHILAWQRIEPYKEKEDGRLNK